MKLLCVFSLIATLLCFSGSIMAKEWSTPEALRAFGNPGDTVSDSVNAETKKLSSSHNKREKTDYSKMSDDELRAIAPKRPTVDYSKMSDEELLAAAPKRRVVDYDYVKDLERGRPTEEVMQEFIRRGVTMNYRGALAAGYSPEEVMAEMNSRLYNVQSIHPPPPGSIFADIVIAPKEPPTPTQANSSWIDEDNNRTTLIVVVIAIIIACLFVVGSHFIEGQSKKDNSARKIKGNKWAKVVFIALSSLAVISIFYIIGGNADQQERHIGRLVGWIGWMIIACPIAFSIGYFTEKAD